MKKLPFTGSGVALITPFTEDGVNYEVLEELIEFQIKNNTDAIIICGTTGEPPTMTEEERREVIKFSVDTVKNRIPVIAGTGANCTKTAVDMSKYAQSVGANALLVVTPYYNKSTQNGLVAHYTEIANSVEIPIILYNVPGRTGVNLQADTILELSKIENIVAVKEASGNFTQIANIASKCKDSIYIYSGNDDQTIPILSLGGKGVISVAANVIPNAMHDMVTEFLAGNVAQARDIQLNSIDLMNALFVEVNPIPVKEAVELLGFDVGNVRLPLTRMSKHNKEKLLNAMKSYGVI